MLSGPNAPDFVRSATLFTNASTSPFLPAQAAWCIAIIHPRLVASSGSWPVVVDVSSVFSCPDAGVMRASHAGWRRLAGALQVTSAAEAVHVMLYAGDFASTTRSFTVAPATRPGTVTPTAIRSKTGATSRRRTRIGSKYGVLVGRDSAR